MEITKHKLIGIAGIAHSGKDITANCINCIITNGTKTNYKKWIDNKDNDEYKNHIIHFADAVKEFLAVALGIPLSYFYDNKYKDEYVYLTDTCGIDTLSNATKKGYKYVSNIMLENIGLEQLKKLNNNKVCFKLRTIMQYFGTDIMRKQFDNNIWINIAIRKARKIISDKGYCIIPDVRFRNEADTIIKNGGIVIKLQREVDIDVNNSKHESEKLDIPDDMCFIIDNNKTLVHLFYAVYSIVTEQIR